VKSNRGWADVIVVGSGAAGAALTWSLGRRGARVICLEQGTWTRPHDFASSRHDFETSLRRGRHCSTPNERGRKEDYPLTAAGDIQPFQIAMANGVGGGTVHWEGHFPRLHPSDFRVRFLDGIADDWPLNYRELEPFYTLNDSRMGISGITGDPANPPRATRTTPPLALGRSGEVIARGFDKLGWHWWPSDNAIISRNWNSRKGCDYRGRCNLGCALRARASVDVAYWPEALRHGAELRTWARAREITLNAAGRADGVLYYDAAGRLARLRAKVVVVCCNGIGSPRLLLNSRSKLFPNGIGNQEGQVGRNFMIHPSRYVKGVFEEPFEAETFTGNPLFSHQFYETDRRRSFLRGYSLVVYRPFGPLSVAWGDVEPVPWGNGHHNEMRRRFAHTVGIAVMGEDLPEAHNQIELDESRSDSNGIAAARLTYRVGDNTRKMLMHGVQTARQVLEAAGARIIRENPQVGFFAHLMGSCRMGVDPRNSVVDKWNRVHGISNLFVVDGSSFTTSGAVNPTSTIGALALRAAEGIWQARQQWV
jgi:choline dehydrogenase-like flavoprotein